MTAIIWTQIAEKFHALRRSGKSRKAAMLRLRELFGCSMRTVYRCLDRHRSSKKSTKKLCAKMAQQFRCNKKRGLLN